MALFFHEWTASLHSDIAKIAIFDIYCKFKDRDKDYFRSSREKHFQDSLENVQSNSQELAKADLLKKEFSEFSWIENIAGSRFTAGAANWHQTVTWEGEEEEMSMYLIMADENFVETLDLELIEGDMEALKMPLTEGEVRYVLNKAALETIDWDVATGQSLNT